MTNSPTSLSKATNKTNARPQRYINKYSVWPESSKSWIVRQSRLVSLLPHMSSEQLQYSDDALLPLPSLPI